MAFYCAGETVRAGKNPYAIEPLRTCEHRVAPQTNPPDIAEPAPLPGYALAPFVLLARLPYEVAAAIFVALSLAGFVASAFALAALARVPPVTAFASLAVIDGYVDISYGENATLAIAALCIAGYFVAKNRDRLGAIAAAAAMFEPHVGLGACLSLFVRRPRARVPLALCGIVALGLSALVVSPAGVVDYFTNQLPLQARSETSALDQYSMTWIAYALGAHDDLAYRIGSYCFLSLLICGVVVAPAVARRLRAPELLVFFPCAMTAFLGVFIHDIELPAAIPAALVVASRTSSRAVWFALVPLAVVWMPWWYGDREATLLGALSVAAIAWGGARAFSRSRRIGFAGASAALYYVGLKLFTAIPLRPLGTPHSVWPAAASLPPGASAALSWGALIRAESVSSPTLQLLVGKIVVWFALATVLVVGARARTTASTREA